MTRSEKILERLEKELQEIKAGVAQVNEDDPQDTVDSTLGTKFTDYVKQVHPKPVSTPPNVEADCNVTGIYKIQDAEQTFNVQFDATFTWIDPSIPYNYSDDDVEDKLEFKDHFIPNIEILGKSQDAEWTVQQPVLLERRSGMCEMKAKFHGDINQGYNMRTFPFDVQYLCINMRMKPLKAIEQKYDGIVGEFQHPLMNNVTHGDDDELLIKRPHWPSPDMDKLTEWDVLRIQGRPTSNGDEWMQGKEKRYDCFQVVIMVSREAQNAVLNLAMLLFFNVLIAFTAYAVPFDEFPDRMSITLTQFLTAMAFKYTASEKLPPVSYLTYMDLYILLGFTLMFIESLGFFIVSRSIPDISQTTQFASSSPNPEEAEPSDVLTFLALTDDSVPGALLAFGVGVGLIDGNRINLDEDGAKKLDDIFFAIVFLGWLVATMYFGWKWYCFEYTVKPKYSKAKSALWIDFAAIETLDEFQANEISRKGQNYYSNLDKNMQGSWLKFIRYGRAPKVLHFDCRMTEGSINLFTFDGIVKRESKQIKVKSIQHFLSKLSSIPELLVKMQDYLDWKTITDLVQKLYRDVPPGLEDIYRSAYVVQASDAEARMKDAITDMLLKVEPDLFVATIPKEVGASPDLQNKIKTVERFFNRMNMNTKVVTNEDCGRDEALAVSYAHSRHLQETPGVVINVQERCMRVTMTRSCSCLTISC